MSCGAVLRVVGLTAVLSACSAGRAGSYSQAESLKNWALSRCLPKASACVATKIDAEKSAAAYLEMGRAGIDVYERLDRLVDAQLRRVYTGSVAGEYNTMKCIDLFRGAELDAAVREAVTNQK
jgi:hypothetical protein